MSITVFFNTMPRYRRRYYKPIVRAQKKRWNITSDQYHSEETNYTGDYVHAGTIAYNSDDNAQPTPAILKVKNATLYGSLQVATVSSTGAGPLFVMSYIIYIPQIVYTSLGNLQGSGLFNFVQSIIDQHPEWIMSTRNVNLQYMGAVNEKATARWTQSTGVLKRNLKSGDRIMLFVTSRFLGGGTIASEFYAESKCNTCAN